MDSDREGPASASSGGEADEAVVGFSATVAAVIGYVEAARVTAALAMGREVAELVVAAVVAVA